VEKMEESYSSSNQIYSSKQKVVGELFYVFIVISCLICITGSIWSIFDYIMPTGKLESFLGFSK